MMLIFVWLTEQINGKKRLVNMQYVEQIAELKEKDGSVLYFSEGKKLLVSETVDQIWEAIKRESAEVRFECWKKMARDKELV